MRYSVVSTGMSIQDIVNLCVKYGGTDIKPLDAVKQVFCDLDPEQAKKLDEVDGVVVKEVKKTHGLGIRAQKIVPKQVVGFKEVEVYLPESIGNGDNGDNNHSHQLTQFIPGATPAQFVNLGETFGGLWASYNPVLIG